LKTENTSILQLHDLSIGYRDSLISGINAEIKKGEIVLLAGKNGCGKTTLLKTIFKEIIPLAGSIKMLDLDINKIPISEIGKLISVVFSKSTVSPHLKVFDLISLGRYPYKRWYEKLTEKEIADINDILELLELEKYRNYYVNELSDGNLQKALTARALIQDCPLLILDEPTSHLDISNKLEIMRIISHLAKEKNKTVLFTSHDLNLGLAVADKLWLIKDNSLRSGFTEDLAYQEDILDYFAGESMKFDYNSNEYGFLSVENKKSIRISGNSQSLYWLQKALVRNGFLLTDHAEIMVMEKDPGFIVSHLGKEHFFSTIEKTLDFLHNI
jgi:iron complex transport system ATP-binding protein